MVAMVNTDPEGAAARASAANVTGGHGHEEGQDEQGRETLLKRLSARLGRARVRLKCIRHGHVYLVEQAYHSPRTALHCARCARRWDIQVILSPAQRVVTDWIFEDGHMLHRVFDNGRQVLALKYNRHEAVAEAGAMLKMAERLVRVVHRDDQKPYRRQA